MEHPTPDFREALAGTPETGRGGVGSERLRDAAPGVRGASLVPVWA